MIQAINSRINNATVLMIEDEVMQITLINKILQKHGFKVIQAMTGKEGLEKAVSFKPDCILLDIGLPDEDGYSIIRKFKEVVYEQREISFHPGDRLVLYTDGLVEKDGKKVWTAAMDDIAGIAEKLKNKPRPDIPSLLYNSIFSADEKPADDVLVMIIESPS